MLLCFPLRTPLAHMFDTPCLVWSRCQLSRGRNRRTYMPRAEDAKRAASPGEHAAKFVFPARNNHASRETEGSTFCGCNACIVNQLALALVNSVLKLSLRFQVSRVAW